ncbi:MAG: LON peptidase substrate-binding domain-containing protein [Burkholderiaceae bacterium]|jgi:Lon protease-like protein|nr:LON peptidase substrate-binding domain-containing protein [Burkholderiaceae bacterium]
MSSFPALRLSNLPLFPLNATLFPQGRLPLRVFEVRYLDLMGRCHKAGAPFGVVTLTAGRELLVPGAPPEQMQSVGTLAHIESLQQTQPGLLHVVCRGDQRFRIDARRRLRHGLWVADVTLLEHDRVVALPPDLEMTARALRQVHERTAPAAGQARYDEAGWVANRWAELLPLPLGTQYQLLALDNPLIRLEVIGDWLARAGICA